MDQYLNRIYYRSLGEASSYGTAPKLLARARKDGKKYSLDRIKDWLSRQDAHTIHKPVRYRFPRNKIITGGLGTYMECDLSDFVSLRPYNQPYRFVLTCLDGFSRKVWVEILRTKTGSEMTQAFKRMFSRMEHVPTHLTSDKGGEFRAREVQDYLKDLNIKFYTTENEDIKSSKIERYQRTLKSALHKHFTATGTLEYASVIQKMVDAYNKTKHSVTGVAPNDVTLKNHVKLWRKMYGRDLKKLGRAMARKGRKPKDIPLAVGDKVRISIAKGKFDKAYRGMWSREIFFVTHVLVPKGGLGQVTVRLKDYNGERIKGRFYLYEVGKIVKNDETDYHRVDKVLKTKGKGRNKKYLVSFEGYDSSHNSWVAAKDLKKL